ncbi:MAG: spoIIIJ-associated protein [Cellvibrionaceae bacterium]|jgi:spoIIIJ-associated protein
MSTNNRSYEFTGESADTAIQKGLDELGLSRTGVSVEVLEEAQNAFLGMGGREARVRLTIQASEPVSLEADEAEEETATHIEEDQAEFDEFDDLDDLPDPELMDEMDMATEILQTFVEGLDLNIQVESRFSEKDDLGKSVIELNLVGEDASRMVGPRGETMASFQYIVRLMISQKIHRRANVTIDIDGYRSSKREGLTSLAERMAKKVVDRDRAVTLEPMNPYERRLVHIALRDDKTVTTQSVGEGTQRRVRILPAK